LLRRVVQVINYPDEADAPKLYRCIGLAQSDKNSGLQITNLPFGLVLLLIVRCCGHLLCNIVSEGFRSFLPDFHSSIVGMQKIWSPDFSYKVLVCTVV
jgi:hypothetical protein